MSKKSLTLPDEQVNQLYAQIASYLHSARKRVLCSVNTEQVKTYWLIGQAIVEREQKGAQRAKYDQELLKQLSWRLIKEFGKGFSVRTLEDVRKFYLIY